MRNTYVLRAGKLVPKSEAVMLSAGYFGVLPDIKPFRTQEGHEITSRSGLRAYEQTNGIKQIGNDMASFHRELRQKVRRRD